MARIDIKDFLRRNGFRHKQDGDRGAVWTNGLRNITVPKHTDSLRPGELAALMDQVRTAARAKDKARLDERVEEARIEAEAAKRPLPPRPLSPEQHAQQQREAGQQMADADDPYLVKVERKPEVPLIAEPPPKPAKRTVAKFKGDERRYVYGRIRALMETPRNGSREIAEALNAEGLLHLPSGKRLDASFISQVKSNWKANPKNRDRYALILMPRQKAGTTPPPPPRAVIVAPPLASAVPRSRFGLPLSIDAVMADPEVPGHHKLQLLRAFVQVPASASALLCDNSLSFEQRLKVIDVVGFRLGSGS